MENKNKGFWIFLTIFFLILSIMLFVNYVKHQQEKEIIISPEGVSINLKDFKEIEKFHDSQNNETQKVHGFYIIDLETGKAQYFPNLKIYEKS